MPSLVYKVHFVDSVKSTNTTVKSLAKEGTPEGYVLAASSQTNGRGRLNVSPPNVTWRSCMASSNAL